MGHFAVQSWKPFLLPVKIKRRSQPGKVTNLFRVIRTVKLVKAIAACVDLALVKDDLAPFMRETGPEQ
jgi:hypothetical protein